MRLSLHRAMLTYGGALTLHTAASGRIAGLDTLYLRLVDADGIEAVGEVRINIAYLNGIPAETVVADALALVRRLDLAGDPADLLADPQRALAAASAPVRMLVDMALHDRAAKRAGLPLAEWLGSAVDCGQAGCLNRKSSNKADFRDTAAGLFQPLIALPGTSPREERGEGNGEGQQLLGHVWSVSHPTNQTLFVSDDGTFLRQAETYVARGFSDLKVRIGAGDFADDLRRIRLLRDRFGADVKLAADANGAWGPEQASRNLADLAPLGLAYVEQPVAPGDFQELARLAEESPVPIMLDESVNGERAIADLAAGGHPLMAHLKLVKLGGIAPTLRAARRLAEANVPLMIGQMNEGGLATAAALHLSASVRPRYAELYGADGIENDPATGLTYLAGTVAVAPAPGLGLAFTPDRTETLWEN